MYTGIDSSVKFSNLDEAYKVCESMNTLAGDAKTNVVTKLEECISSLKKIWIGSDASNHINNLTLVCNGVREVVEDCRTLSSAAGSIAVENQKKRKTLGGSGMVGSELPYGFYQDDNSRLSDTEEYEYDAALLDTEYKNLETIYKAYETFETDYTSYMGSLLNTYWESGGNKELVSQKYNTVVTEKFVTFRGYLSSAKDALNTAVSVLSK